MGERWRRRGGGGGAPPRAAATLGGGGPCPFLFLGHGSDLEELLPLLGGCEGGGFSWLWVVCSKIRVSPQYVMVEMQSWAYDGFPFDLRTLGHL
jgi:hypothetical protein